MDYVVSLLKEGPYAMRRAGRHLLWGHPHSYRLVGLMRGYGDCLKDGFDVWMCGFPRSANTFALAAFKLANPEVRVASHFHIPAFVVNALRKKRRGLLLLREPQDAVISWTIFWNGAFPLTRSLDYYLDFHRALLPHRAELFVAPFEEVTNRFGEVVARFNERFGTEYAALPSDSQAGRRCHQFVEDFVRGPDGSVNEFQVSRPSTVRAALKPALQEQLETSPDLVEKLKRAKEVYEMMLQPEVSGCAVSGRRLPGTDRHPGRVGRSSCHSTAQGSNGGRNQFADQRGSEFSI